MSDYTSFYLNCSGEVADINCIEIEHPAFKFNLQSYDEDGFYATHEDGREVIYRYLPMQIDRPTINSDLDQIVKMTIFSPDDSLIDAYKNIEDAQPVLFRQRIYRSDNLGSPMITIQTLHITAMNIDSDGFVTFEAKAPELNSVKTGDAYNFERFPMLKATI